MFKFLMTYYVALKKVKGIWYGMSNDKSDFQAVPDFLLSAGREYVKERKILEARLKANEG